MNILLDKFKEILFSVLPIIVLTVLMNFIFIHIEYHVFIRFLIGSVLIIIGLTFFLFGIETGVAAIGLQMGHEITKRNKALILIAAGFALGFVISIAEPDLHILAEQVKEVTQNAVSAKMLILTVSAGVAAFVVFGLLRIVFNLKQNITFALAYGAIFLAGLFSSAEFISIAFDSSGTTTGAITVPFILALAISVSAMKKNSMASESDSFGLVGMASAGAILAVLLLSAVNGTKKNISRRLSIRFKYRYRYFSCLFFQFFCNI